MVELQLSIQMIGVLSSLIAAGFTMIPALGATDTRRAITAIVVLLAGVFYEQGMEFTTVAEFTSLFFAAAVYAVGTYKLFLQPIVKPLVISTLSAMTARAKG